MKMRTLVILAVSLLVAADDPKSKDAKSDNDKLQGTWKVTKFEQAGQLIPDGLLDQLPQMVFKGDRYIFKTGDEGEEGTFKLDTSKKPKQIDLKITEGSDKGKDQVGIYELDGDTLKFCFALPDGKERPKEFAAKEGTLNATLKRAKP